MAKYRIVTDQYAGFEVQRRFLFIFWFEVSTNTFRTIEEAKEHIEKLKNPFKIKVVYTE
jgi:hypothetical protein